MSCNLHTFITFQLKYKFIFSHLFVFTCEGRDRLTIKGFSFVERLFPKGGNLIFLYCLLKKSESIKLLLSFVTITDDFRVFTIKLKKSTL